jgi:hypothetical protein
VYIYHGEDANGAQPYQQAHASGNVAATGSEAIVDRGPSANYHNGGALQLGNDGLLHISSVIMALRRMRSCWKVCLEKSCSERNNDPERQPVLPVCQRKISDDLGLWPAKPVQSRVAACHWPHVHQRRR